jgi:pimeloyl-ACP methyl ester carboxylesterase
MLAALSQKCQVVIFDNRGAGQSDKPDIPYTMQMMADDLAGLLDVIGLKTAHIFGISMGSMIAQHFALQYSKRVTSLILGGTTCGGSHAVAPDAATMATLFDFERMQKMAPEERFKELISVMYSDEFIKNNPSVIQEMAKQGIENPPNPLGSKRQAQAIMGHDTYKRLPEIRVPTLVIHGDLDRITPVENARIVASRILNAKTVILEGKGHGITAEAPVQTVQAILDFVGTNGR